MCQRSFAFTLFVDNHDVKFYLFSGFAHFVRFEFSKNFINSRIENGKSFSTVLLRSFKQKIFPFTFQQIAL